MKKASDRVLATACVALFAILIVTVTWQVFTRQVLNEPSSWSEELAKYVFVWLGMFGAALVFSERGHIAVDVVARKLPEPIQRVVAVGVQLIVLVFAGLTLVWGGLRLTAVGWGQSLTALPGHLGLVYLVMPITGVIIAYYALYHVASILRRDEVAVETDHTAEEV
ncbi:TRAP transporter small permease [Allosaccharopolyspora coralli]|uniref:TRAP transporter small permease n=1 Tax=Allosaccharopolyspora coralli TaxID=2665642 RepID=UPI001C9E830A|nr:TRAP transporter small permease [Allosaccharopolyspora coralli]